MLLTSSVRSASSWSVSGRLASSIALSRDGALERLHLIGGHAVPSSRWPYGLLPFYFTTFRRVRQANRAAEKTARQEGSLAGGATGPQGGCGRRMAQYSVALRSKEAMTLPWRMTYGRDARVRSASCTLSASMMFRSASLPTSMP